MVTYEAEHIKALLRWLRDEVLGASGDGDSLWLSEHYTLEQILPLIEEVNKEAKYPWNITVDSVGKLIDWGEGQEGVVITTDKELFERAPEWIQAKLRW